jgi:sulfatase-like protein
MFFVICQTADSPAPRAGRRKGGPSRGAAFLSGRFRVAPKSPIIVEGRDALGVGIKSGESSRVTAATKLKIACLALPSFNDGSGSATAQALPERPHFGYGDSAPYGEGPGRGMPTPNLERLANEGMTFFSLYAQPSCTPGRAASANRAHSQPQRHNHRGLPGPGRRLPAAEWTLGSVLKQAGYQTFFSGMAKPITRCPTSKGTMR